MAVRPLSLPTEGSGALLAAAVNIPYNLLHTATAGFAPVAHSRGGHKLGEGGSGEVFYCQVPLKTGQEKEEVAVKVLRRVKDKVSVGFIVCFIVT